jgi:hypothetical protein
MDATRAKNGYVIELQITGEGGAAGWPDEFVAQKDFFVIITS